MNDILVTKCVVSWSLQNVRHGENDKIIIDGNVIQIPKGYYTFSDLEKILKKHDITISKLHDNRVTLTSNKDLDLSSFGPVLGFDQDKTITKSVEYTSIKPAQMTNGLKDIRIFCSLVDSSKNYSYISDSDVYLSSNFLILIPIDTTQNLNGVFTTYDTNGYCVPCRGNYRLQDIEFIVESEGHVDDYEIFLSVRIV